MSDRRAYWLSDAGMADWDRRLHKHYAELLDGLAHTTHPIGFLPDVPVEVVHIDHFPAPGRLTMLTRGLSGFLLSDPEAGSWVRQEFAISTHCQQVDDIAKPLLAAAADHALRHARYVPEHVAIPADASAHLTVPGCNAVIVPFLGIWLPPRACTIEADIPGYITELSLLSRDEYVLLQHDFDAFKRTTESSDVDYTDFRRPLT